MKTLSVSVSDIYSTTHFEMDVPDMHAETIKYALEVRYPEWSGKLTKTLGGCIRVSDAHGYIAKGSILWWFDGKHTIRLEAVGQDSTLQDAHVQTSGHHTVCQTPV